MNKLIALELKRNSLRPYHIAVLICGAAMLAFQYLMAAIPHIDPTEPDIEMFSSYNFLIGMNNIVCMGIFAILAAVMAARFVVEEYNGKRAILLFSYPVSRKKVMGAKLALVFLYSAAAMFLCGVVIQGVFFMTEALFPLCNDRLTFGMILQAFLSLICYSLLAGLLGLLALWFGFLKQSVSVTIVAAVIVASLVCQIMAAALSFQPVMWIVLGAATILAAFAVINMLYQVENAEV